MKTATKTALTIEEERLSLLEEASRLLMSMAAPDGYGPGVPSQVDEAAAKALAQRIQEAL